MIEVTRCRACGGSVVWDAAQSSAACLFCATVALEVVPESPPAPDAYLPMRVGQDAAAQQFRDWATRSWFRPQALRSAQISLQPMLLPAWRIHARLETHWAGLRRASSRSGRAPASGVERTEITDMIPASMGLDPDELVGLMPFDEGDMEDWDRDGRGEALVWEPPALTRRGAISRARRALLDRHRRRILDERGLVSARVSAIIEERDLRLLLVPIYIGSFRFRGRPWRFLINAQTGVVVGAAPLDRRKVAALIAAAAVLLAVALVWANT